MDTGQPLSDFHLSFAAQAMTRQRVCLQALDGNVFATALADSVDTVSHVFKRLLDLFEPKVFSIAHVLGQVAIDPVS